MQVQQDAAPAVPDTQVMRDVAGYVASDIQDAVAEEMRLRSRRAQRKRSPRRASLDESSEDEEAAARHTPRLRVTQPTGQPTDAGSPAEPLRPAQQALFDEAVADDGNVVLVAGTGFGKTRVALAVVEAALLRHPRRAVVFLCPTVPLANQQRDYWERCGLGGGQLSSAVAAGGGGAGFNAARVTFATPAKFVAHYCADPRALAGLALLVVDECHHAYRAAGSSATGSSSHPYSEVAEAYRACPAHMRPKLIGLTASPGASRADVEGLAALLQSRFVSAARASVAETVALAVAGEAGRKLASNLMRLERHVVQTNKRIAATDDEAEKGRRGEQMAHLIGLSALWRAVGSGAALCSACAGLEGAEPYLALDRQARTRKREAGEEEGPRRVMKGNVSPVAELALQQLRMAAGRGGEDFRAVVFVQTQLAALALAAHLRAAVAAGEGAWLRPGLLVGQSGDAGMTQTMQKEALARFRDGTVTVLLATSIAEEGLDIQKCGLVIRTEPPRTIIQNIQGRGRARQLDAVYAVVVLEEMMIQKTNKKGNLVDQWPEPEYIARLGAGENHAWEVLQQCIACAGTGVTATSWSHFDSEQVADVLLQRVSEVDHQGGPVWKNRLQKFLMQRDRPGNHIGVSTYSCTSRGPPHQRRFIATVTVHSGAATFEGEECSTKKSSEQSAAWAALGSLTIDGGVLQVDPVAVPAWSFSYNDDAVDESSEEEEASDDGTLAPEEDSEALKKPKKQ